MLSRTLASQVSRPPTGEEGLVYPARFEYTAPTTLEEVIATLAEHGDEAKLLAGGQSLIPLMKLRFATPGVIVDINGVSGLDYTRSCALCPG